MLEKIGKYEIRLQIGRGAMGVVYEAWDTLIERRVALKTLRTDRIEASQRPDLLARFRREAQAVGRLSHPHIVTIHDYGDQDGTPYLVMEYIAGHELAHDLARSARFPLEDVVRIMTQMLGALAHAHEHGVVHRDLKPANIFLLEDGSLKVVDFGIARVDGSDFTVLTSDGATLGTPAYMSPEQVNSLPVDNRSDLFSAGVILYEMLVGERPFTGESVHTVKQKVRNQEPLRPSEANPTLSPAWDKVIERALAKKPSARYETARQFSEAIKSAFQAERAHGEESRLKAAEANEHALRAAEERSRAEAQRRAEEDRREAEQVAKAAAQARKAAEESARREAELRARAEVKVKAALSSPPPAPPPLATPAAAPSRLPAIAGYLYVRQSADSEAAKADAARLAAETRARDEIQKRTKVEALAREETERRARLESDVARKEADGMLAAELVAKARAEDEAKKVTEEKAKVLALKKSDDTAKKEAESRAKAEVEAGRKAEELAKQQAELETRQKADALAKRQAEEKAALERVNEATMAAEKSVQIARERAAQAAYERLARGYDGFWTGTLSCSALSDSRASIGDAAPIFLDVVMSVKDQLATLQRNNRDVVEELTGRITSSGNSLSGEISLNGRGYWRDIPSRAWIYSFSGTFVGDSFRAKGAMRTLEGRLLRQCELRLAR